MQCIQFFCNSKLIPTRFRKFCVTCAQIENDCLSGRHSEKTSNIFPVTFTKKSKRKKELDKVLLRTYRQQRRSAHTILATELRQANFGSSFTVVFAAHVCEIFVASQNHPVENLQCKHGSTLLTTDVVYGGQGCTNISPHRCNITSLAF